MKHIVYADLPKSGMGNLLLVWAKAKVFSHLNAIPLVTSRWWGIRFGAWVRNESRKRIYWGYFNETPWHKQLSIRFWKQVYPVVSEPDIDRQTLPAKPVIFCFTNPLSQNTLFQSIKPYRAYIKEEIYKLVKPNLLRKLAVLPDPEIAVHIRRGDFKIASKITPISFFVDCIRYIRSETGMTLRVTVFTDAPRDEIREVLEMEKVSLAERKADILDMLQMSRSRVLVVSQTSTFSYWSAFLSEGIIIRPSEDWYDDIRPLEINAERYEGKINFDLPETLLPLKAALRKDFLQQCPPDQF